ncbi:MAG TPA: DUF1206 domain-containing protein [Sphingobacteriaceae bacterium]|nr:DUF1206 domain-containing protein [Sphingobacteriaceae bacterium]
MNFSSSFQRPSWVKPVAKVGLIAKGIVYCLIGFLAFMTAFKLRSSKNENDTQGVFKFILEQPAGRLLLAVITLGLLCYCIWRFLQSFFNTSHKKDNAKGYGKRFAYFFSGITYLALCYLAGNLVLGKGGSGGDSRQEMVQEMLSKPGGQWLVGIAAAIFAGIGVYQIIYGFSEKYKKHINSQELNEDASTSLLRAGKIGYISRGIVWMIIAFLFLKAALYENAREAGDTSSAFKFVKDGPFGTYLLSALALGLVCYGIMNFIRAAYERI